MHVFDSKAMQLVIFKTIGEELMAINKFVQMNNYIFMDVEMSPPLHPEERWGEGSEVQNVKEWSKCFTIIYHKMGEGKKIKQGFLVCSEEQGEERTRFIIGI